MTSRKPLASSRRRLNAWGRRLYLSATDRGWFGRTPLETHVVICGFSRSGSSLLQAMVRSCVADAVTFPDETKALVAARRARRDQAVMVTKSPADADRADAIRDHYEGHTGRPLFVVMVRHPYEVLTSRVPGSQETYAFADPRGWERRCQSVLALLEADDAIPIRYETLVSDTSAAEQDLTYTIGWTVSSPFEDYLSAAAESRVEWGDFLEMAMGGARAPEPAADRRRSAPEHQARLRECHEAVPRLAEYVELLGY